MREGAEDVGADVGAVGVEDEYLARGQELAHVCLGRVRHYALVVQPADEEEE